MVARWTLPAVTEGDRGLAVTGSRQPDFATGRIYLRQSRILKSNKLRRITIMLPTTAGE